MFYKETLLFLLEDDLAVRKWSRLWFREIFSSNAFGMELKGRPTSTEVEEPTKMSEKYGELRKYCAPGSGRLSQAAHSKGETTRGRENGSIVRSPQDLSSGILNISCP